MAGQDGTVFTRPAQTSARPSPLPLPLLSSWSHLIAPGRTWSHLTPQLTSLPTLQTHTHSRLSGAAQGVAYRDVKPANALLDASDPPVLQLCDFGAAR